LTKIIEKRLEKFKKKLSANKIDTFLVIGSENRFYLSGFNAQDTQIDESSGALLITHDRLIIATDSRYVEQAKIESPLFEVICYKKGLSKEIPSILGTLNTKNLGFESKRMSFFNVQEFKKNISQAGISVKMTPTDDLIEDLRIIKDASEIENTKAALNVGESAFKNIISKIKPGITERKIAWELEKGMRQLGADSCSFPIIAASGPNSALPHAIPGDRRLQAGEPILFDWGVKLEGYCSDTSRTIFLGKPDSTFKKVYSTVLNAQKKAIGAIGPGISSKAIDAIARDYIDSKGFKGKFGHGLGHGTGLAIHEKPRLSQLVDIILEPGMIFTVEPGIYLPGWGGVRIENQVVVRENGVEVLNDLEVDLH